MNEIGVQQLVTAKTRASTPERQPGNAKETGTKDPAVSVNQAEARQIEQTKSPSAFEEIQKQKDAQTTEERVEKAVAQLNDYVQNTERKLEFQMDEDSGQTVVRVYDKNSEELIRQIPNEEALELAQKLNQEEPLMLFSAQV